MPKRCFGDKPGQEFYANYHDHEWGIPVHDDQKLFEMLILEGAQAGLSWETVLKKRAGYRQAFHNFEITKVANMTDLELDTLRANPEIIRNRLKIYSARQNAQVFLKIQQEFGSFDNYLWGFVNHQPIINPWTKLLESPELKSATFTITTTNTAIITTSTESDKLSKDLKKRGMNFVGSTIIYAYMQAVGLVNDHMIDCWRNKTLCY